MSSGAPANGTPAEAAGQGASAIAGIGMDLLRTERVVAALARHGDRFAQRILTPDELARFTARRARAELRGVRFLATRFAAKEAFSKAVGLGMRMPMYWRAVQFLNERSGRPVVTIVDPVLRAWCAERYGAFHVSLTDESDLVAAYVIAERR
ncbi:holo-ACP synthase [Achromobacter sp. GG226]|uniref:holo-ACP synthase n=1 Tax=Verticiella alkaliphila TaxID=2779529 RepID=UPI001C0D9BEE|nr:holo-ACP synthase [Verticiella sp. GG226]MBU4611886.1 holo-ACP synthase [Verticiella sp. GG226]